MSYRVPFVIAVPTFYDRRHLVPLPDTPWLQPRRVPSAVWPLLFSVGFLLLLTIPASPVFASGLLMLLILSGGVLGLCDHLRRQAQICPACTSGMARGSWRCPHCRYEAR